MASPEEASHTKTYVVTHVHTWKVQTLCQPAQVMMMSAAQKAAMPTLAPVHIRVAQGPS